MTMNADDYRAEQARRREQQERERHRTPDEWAWMEGKQFVNKAGWEVDDRALNGACSREEYERRAAASVLMDIPEPPMLPPVDESLRKTDIEDHLRRHHHGRYYLTKPTKADLIKMHDNLHKKTNAYAYNDYNYTPVERHHQHSTVDMTIVTDPEVPMDNIESDRKQSSEKVDEAMESASKGRPLNATQRKALETLINNDFSVLTSQMRQLAVDFQTQRKEEIDADFAEKEKEAAVWSEKMRDLSYKHNMELAEVNRKHQEERAKFAEEAKDAGLEVGKHSVAVAGKDAAIKEANQAVMADLNRALTTAERQRLSAQRTVLMASVTPQALDLLGTIPSAKDLMLQASQEDAPKAVTG